MRMNSSLRCFTQLLTTVSTTWANGVRNALAPGALLSQQNETNASCTSVEPAFVYRMYGTSLTGMSRLRSITTTPLLRHRIDSRMPSAQRICLVNSHRVPGAGVRRPRSIPFVLQHSPKGLARRPHSVGTSSSLSPNDLTVHLQRAPGAELAGSWRCRWLRRRRKFRKGSRCSALLCATARCSAGVAERSPAAGSHESAWARG